MSVAELPVLLAQAERNITGSRIEVMGISRFMQSLFQFDP